jgi:hypothetical protein
MDNFSYFHLCNHQIKKAPNDGEMTTIIVDSSFKPIETIINGAIILKLLEVRAIEYDALDAEIVSFFYDNDSLQTYDDVDPGESYYDDKKAYIIDYSKYFMPGATISNPLPTEFYEPALHNRIKWSVKPPKKYQVLAMVRYTNTSYQKYKALDCPICGGKGWFIDILTKEGLFSQPTGVTKVAQRVVKDFLTELGSSIFDLKYGTKIRDDMLIASSDEDQLFDKLRLTFSMVEDNYLNDQQATILKLTPDEILLSLSVEQVHRHPSKPTVVIVQLKIKTSSETQIFQIGI